MNIWVKLKGSWSEISKVFIWRRKSTHSQLKRLSVFLSLDRTSVITRTARLDNRPYITWLSSQVKRIRFLPCPEAILLTSDMKSVLRVVMWKCNLPNAKLTLKIHAREKRYTNEPGLALSYYRRSWRHKINSACTMLARHIAFSRTSRMKSGFSTPGKGSRYSERWEG